MSRSRVRVPFAAQAKVQKKVVKTTFFCFLQLLRFLRSLRSVEMTGWSLVEMTINCHLERLPICHLERSREVLESEVKTYTKHCVGTVEAVLTAGDLSLDGVDIEGKL